MQSKPYTACLLLIRSESIPPMFLKADHKNVRKKTKSFCVKNDCLHESQSVVTPDAEKKENPRKLREK